MKRTFLFVAAIAGLIGRADGAFITAITNGAGQNVGGFLSPTWSIDNGSGILDTSPDPGFLSPEGAGPRVINMAVTVLRKFSPFNVQIATRALGGTGAVDTFYTLNITVTNGLTYANSAHNLMNGFDFKRVSESGSGISVVSFSAPTPNPGIFGLETPVSPNLPSPLTLNGINANDWRFGGLNGGGPTLAPGASTTVSLGIRVVQANSAPGDRNRTTNFSFTANPEPTTLLLGSLVMGPAAYAMRRRRKAEAVEAA